MTTGTQTASAPGRLRSVAPSTWVVVALGLGVVVAAGVVGIKTVTDDPGSRLEQAMRSSPIEGQRFTFTDWAGVRTEMGVSLSNPTAAEVASFLDAGFEADLTSNSSLIESSEVAEVQLGFSPGTVTWELLAQWTEGSTVSMGVPAGFDFEALERNLGRLGYRKPSSKEPDIWQGGTDVVARLGIVSPYLAYVAPLKDERMIVISDTQPAAEVGVSAAVEKHDLDDAMADVVEAVGDPLSASVYTGDYACEALAMGDADEVDQAEGDQLLEAAGDVNPYRAFSLAAERGMEVRVAMSFETEEQARTNATTRDQLARGPAPGQGGEFGDRFRVDQVAARGNVVTIDVSPEPGSYVLSDLSNGPVLFATC